MRNDFSTRSSLKLAAAIGLALFSVNYASPVYALPVDGKVTAGDAGIDTSGQTMNIDQKTGKVAIDWKSFDIDKGETVNFKQPGADSIALNRVIGNDASRIYGNLNANGQVFLINQNGILFGQGAQVDVGGLIASTRDIDMQAFMNATDTYQFSGSSDAKVINAGEIKAQGGVVALLAKQVDNQGTIVTVDGTTALAAGDEISIDYEGDGKINLSVDKAVVNAAALNSGSIQANGGYVLMTARDASKALNTVIRNTGRLEAKTLSVSDTGEIVLSGGDQGIVEAGGVMDVSGDASGQKAGTIRVIGQNTDVTGILKATGDTAGGLIETSGTVLNVGEASIDASSVNGTAGEWLLDPMMVVIGDKDTGPATGGIWTYTGGASNTVSYIKASTIDDLLNKGTAVKIQAVDNPNKVASIEVNSAIAKTTGKDTSLTLEAQRSITVNQSITASGTGKLDVTLHSDTDGDAFGSVVVNADIATNGGAFTAGGGSDITKGTVGTYFGHRTGEALTANRIITTNGGAINLYGDVAVGLNGAQLQLNTAGGNITITGNVDSGNSYTAYTDLMTDGKYSAQWEKLLLDYYNATHKVTVKSLTDTQKTNLTNQIVHSWDKAKIAAALGSTGTTGTAVGDKYLATITTSLENSLANATIGGAENELFVGGQQKSDGKFYWVTGTEGAENNGQGVAFAEKDGTGINGSYVNWVKGASSQAYGNSTYTEPNGSGKNVAVGWSLASKWDDVADSAKTLHGFVQETNLENSALNINAGAGNVTIGGNVGESKALSNFTVTNNGDVTVGGMAGRGNVTVSDSQGKIGAVKIDSLGNVTVGGKINAVGNVDIGVNNTGSQVKSATVGDKITSKMGQITILADGNITTHAAQSPGKIFYWTDKGTISDDKTIESVNSVQLDANAGSILVNNLSQTGTTPLSDPDYQHPMQLTAGKGLVKATGTITGQDVDIIGGQIELLGKTTATTNDIGMDAYLGNAEVSDMEATHGLIQVVSNKPTDANGNAIGNVIANGTITAGQSVYLGANHDVTTKAAIRAGTFAYLEADHNAIADGAVSAGTDAFVTAGHDITTHEVQAGNKILVSSNGGTNAEDGGTVTLKGTLTAGAENNNTAVVVGTEGKFINEVGSNVINVGTGSNWQVYSYAPDTDEFGSLNSNTNAIWNHTYTSTKAVDTSNANHYIFEVQPTATISTVDVSKTYGEDYVKIYGEHKVTVSRTYNGTDLSTYNDAFQEDGAKITATASSVGDAATADRTHGQYASDDGNMAIYDIAISDVAAPTDYKTEVKNGKLTINRKELTATTADMDTTYGTVNTNYDTSITGWVNGDEKTTTVETEYATKAYVDNNTRTNNVGAYDLTTTVTNLSDIRNYKISTKPATVTVGVKTVTLTPSGSGTTVADAVITDGTPSYEAQLVNGDSLLTAPIVFYSVGGATTNANEYGVSVEVNNSPIQSGDVVGNYRFNYKGLVTLQPAETNSPAEKPLIDYLNPSNLNGNGLYGMAAGTNGVPGVDRVAGLASAELPFFKVLPTQVVSYGTYDVAADPDQVRLTPSAKILPEPKAIQNQYREYTKDLTTSLGEAGFKLTYNGSKFEIMPVDQKAVNLLKAGDSQKNVELASKALFAGFSEMGLVLEDLDGIYIHMNPETGRSFRS